MHCARLNHSPQADSAPLGGAAMGRFPTIAWGGEHKNEVIETDCSIRLLRLESDGEQLPSQLPSRKSYREDYNALIFNGKKNPSVPKNALLAMGRYGQSVWGDMCNVTT